MTLSNDCELCDDICWDKNMNDIIKDYIHFDCRCICMECFIAWSTRSKEFKK